jgi:mannose-6-phosphate isomerase-like protein (cupin superfamily)
MEKTFNKKFTSPDETRKFKAHGQMDVLNFGDAATIGRGVFEPGWKWSVDVKPIANTPSCQNAHTGYCVSGSMTVKMDSGEQFTVRPGEALHIPPGHDAWTEGTEACVLIDVTGVKNYAKPS